MTDTPRTNKRIVEYFARLLNRVEYNNYLDEQKGPNTYRILETESVQWAIDCLADDFAPELAEAEQVVRERARRRKERSQP